MPRRSASSASRQRVSPLPATRRSAPDDGSAIALGDLRIGGRGRNRVRRHAAPCRWRHGGRSWSSTRSARRCRRQSRRRGAISAQKLPALRPPQMRRSARYGGPWREVSRRCDQTGCRRPSGRRPRPPSSGIQALADLRPRPASRPPGGKTVRRPIGTILSVPAIYSRQSDIADCADKATVGD